MKKARSSSPILKLTLIMVFTFVAGFFIFYSIDNPDFLKSKFYALSGESESGEAIEAPGSDGGIQSAGSSEEPDSAGEPAEIETEENGIKDGSAEEITSTGSDGKESDDGYKRSLSLWQKIMGFIAGLTGKGGVREGEEVYPSSIEINFYFSGVGEEKKLVSEKRTINAGSPGIAVQNAVKELLKGPVKSYHFPVIPAGTELIGVEAIDNIAKVDLSREFLENSLDTRILDEYIIYSMVNTLTEIPEIEGVIFYIDGVRIKVYGNIDLSIPAIRNKELIDEE